MKRKIVTIDEALCNGCGLCVGACHEGALQLVGGKARLVSDSYCDGLGNCLPECPTGAIRIEEREAAPFDEAAVLAAGGSLPEEAPDLPCGCPGTQARTLHAADRPATAGCSCSGHSDSPAPEEPASDLAQWPCQIKLVPVNAPYLRGARLLVAADCAAYAYAAFHRDFMRGRITLVGCPKLDGVDYAEKLAAILRANDIRSVTVVRMEVPCCGGLERAVTDALMASGKMIPWQVVTIGTDGRILSD
ncbi:MAG: 4Fe-4S binding protein [Clostridia bacterium]|nr:4Fe-4S binding protein [Clostridia bacterium]